MALTLLVCVGRVALIVDWLNRDGRSQSLSERKGGISEQYRKRRMERIGSQSRWGAD